MKLTPNSTARRRTAIAVARSFGGPQTPSPVRRMAPKPRRLTVSSPPRAIVPLPAADRLLVFSLIFIFILLRPHFVGLLHSAVCQLESGPRCKSFTTVGVLDPRSFS